MQIVTTERTEIRAARLVFGKKCDVTGSNGPANAEVFASAPMSITSTGFQLLESSTSKRTVSPYSVECAVELPAGPLPYCVDGRVPKGPADRCLSFKAGTNLSINMKNGTVMDRGRKVAD